MRSLGILLCILAYGVSAEASPITYSFTGTVNEVGTHGVAPVSIAQHVPIQLTLDRSFPDQDVLSPGVADISPDVGYYTTSGSAILSPVLRATIAGRNVRGLFSTVVVRTDSSIDIFSQSPEINSGFHILLSGARPGALPTDAVPLSLDPAEFSMATFSVTEAFNPRFIGYSGVIDTLSVPEPGSLGVLATALFALCLGGTRRRALAGGRSPRGGRARKASSR